LIEWDKVLNATANDNWEHLKFMIQQQKYILVVFIPMSCYTLEWSANWQHLKTKSEPYIFMSINMFFDSQFTNVEMCYCPAIYTFCYNTNFCRILYCLLLLKFIFTFGYV